ncbi:MAG: hypothetical protein AAFX05_11980 [Planctomycetota bacterium]
MAPTRIHRRIGRLAALLMASVAAGCISPDAIAPTLAHQRTGVTALAASYHHDLRLLRELIENTLAQRRALLTGQLHRELIVRGYIVAGPAADVDAFARDRADPAAESTLVRAVRDGRMTTEQAEAYLRDYVLAMRLSDGRDLRRQMLAELEPLKVHDAAAEDALKALQDHVDVTAALLNELQLTTSALEMFAASETGDVPPARSDIESLLRQTLLIQIEDDERREHAAAALAAAMDVLDTLSGDAP